MEIPVSDQDQVWADIDTKLECMGAGSPTSAIASMYAKKRQGLRDFTEELTAEADQLGAVFAIGDRIAGMEFFDCVETFGKLYPKIVGSYAIDVMEMNDKELAAPPAREAQGFLNQIGETEMEVYPSLGLGNDLRVAEKGLAGGGLLLDEDVIHFAAFVR